MEDGDTESENASRVIQDFVFMCRKIGSIKGYLLWVYNKLLEEHIIHRYMYKNT